MHWRPRPSRHQAQPPLGLAWVRLHKLGNNATVVHSQDGLLLIYRRWSRLRYRASPAADVLPTPALDSAGGKCQHRNIESP